MQATIDEKDLARNLPGGWTIAATNLPIWLNGERRSPHFTYELVGENPLVFADDVSYVTADGEQKHIIGQNTWGRDGFSSRGKGVQRLFTNRWTVSGMSDDAAIAVVRYSKSRATDEGIDVIIRDGIDKFGVRAIVARSTEVVGLTPEDFGSLSWLLPAS